MLFLRRAVQKKYKSRFNSFHSSPSSREKLFDKILIANRGEIACRIVRTCKKLGIKTVAVYSDADTYSLHVRTADEAVNIGPPPSSKSYLIYEKIVEAAKKTGAQAVHPGYGFLSENHHFVQRLEQEGIVFIGPGSDAMRSMGEKIESKRIAKKAGVSIVPGYVGPVDDVNHAIKIAKDIGYPVMIKASSGGGGKGMRIAWNDEEVKVGYRLSKSEAKSSFGDDTLLVEKFIDNPRHIEFQLICDGENFLYLPERECSIQRRNQKVVEEAPSPFIDPQTRKLMGEQAASLARAVKYQSAGTVEFLVDSKRNFYFLEMNTRLQVEHPITEYVTGLDLVELMIRVAAGQKLPIKQEDVKIKGWAVESRVYAEDPLRNFLPSIGKLKTYIEPVASDGTIRVDTGVVEGSEISIYYDPLIAKLATYGPDRKTSIDTMSKALDSYVIRGVRHNINFLREVMSNPRFLEGRLTTKFIPEEFPEGFKGHRISDAESRNLITVAAAVHLTRHIRDLTINRTVKVLDASGIGKTTFHVLIGADANYDVTVEPDNNSPTKHNVTIDGKTLTVDLSHWPIDHPLVEVNLEGKQFIVQIFSIDDLGYTFQHCGTNYPIKIFRPKEIEKYAMMPKPTELDTTNILQSPMAGTLLSVAVNVGDEVTVGRELAIVEAMKMQNVLRAERDGVIKEIRGKVGEPIELDGVILEFEKKNNDDAEKKGKANK
eukprot:TRINITY_DN175_c0_g2_i1.p1 TRINITY_DN175_c0_g2~~TRINITY_DN175_c0_g2_i1.p1  ORF type:complete len:713 (-),score=144.21 TRINITY_DN175_c0_g2_i1:56-2194(-)